MRSAFEAPADIGTARHEDDVSAIVARLAQSRRPAAPIAFYGSSSFRLWQSMAQDLDSLDAVNLGFGGATNASGLFHLNRLLTPLRPAKVVLYFGENDISADGLDAQSALRNAQALREGIRQALPDVPVFALSAKQSLAKWLYADVVDEFNRRLQAWCSGAEHTHFVDVTSVLLGEHGRPMGRYYQDDLIHLNGAGYLQWARILRQQPGLLG